MTSTTVLNPGQKQTFTGEDESDLVIIDPNDGSGVFTYASNQSPARSHDIGAHQSWNTVVGDGDSATVHNTGSVSLKVKFG